MSQSSKVFAVRLPESLLAELEQAAEQRGVTASEIIRESLSVSLRNNIMEQRHLQLLYEVGKTRALLLRWLDRELGDKAVDKLLESVQEVLEER